MPRRASQSLAESHPKLVGEWHPTKNGTLTPSDVSKGTGRKVWWKCPKGPDHEWEAAISSRASGVGCSVCRGWTVVASNCLATVHPGLAKEWHPTRNEISAREVYAFSTKKYWWRCPVATDHEWEAKIISRTGSGTKPATGCPFCQPGSCKRVAKSNCLATTHPHLAAEWHATRNGELTPADVTHGSDIVVVWKCPAADDHEWQTSISNRAAHGNAGSNCPFCAPASRSAVFSNSLAITHPLVAATWHDAKNFPLTPSDVVAGSARKVWWRCPKGVDHVWESTVAGRVKQMEADSEACSVCANRVTVKSNSLATRYPAVAVEWHPIKNGEYTPEMMPAAGSQLAWWQCPVAPDHVWRTRIVKRTESGQGCPACAGLLVVDSNCLATTHPDLAAEWHPTRNRLLSTRDVVAGTKKSVWWRCPINPRHFWRTQIYNRVRGTGCPHCILAPRSRAELALLFELKHLFPSIPEEQQKLVVDGRLRNLDIVLPQFRTVIEYDGKYWHRDKEDSDRELSVALQRSGYCVLRVRERPLPSLGIPHEVSIDASQGTKATVDMVVKWIVATLPLGAVQKRRAEAYCAQPLLLNRKGVRDYVQRVLVERAAKRHRKTPPLADLTRLVMLDPSIQTYRDVCEAVRSLGGRRMPPRPLYYRIRDEFRIL
jgi:hypothetical protein